MSTLSSDVIRKLKITSSPKVQAVPTVLTIRASIQANREQRPCRKIEASGL
jgi:hypothetical protein